MLIFKLEKCRLDSCNLQTEILADYEDLELADIYAVLTYATKLSQVKRLLAVA